MHPTRNSCPFVFSIEIKIRKKLEEMFLGFRNCDTGVTGEALAESILTQLSSWRLSIDLGH